MAGKQLTLTLTLLALVLVTTSPAHAKIKEAEAAFQAGDFATALKELKPYLKKKKQPTKANLILARMYLEGLGVPANYSRAFQHLSHPAKKGNAWAATELGKLYLTGAGVMHSNAMAKTWFEKAASVGYGPAQIELGHIHAKGLSVASNQIMAYAWYNLAASSLMGEQRTVALQYRDQLATTMTDAEIIVAQARSLDWADRIKVVEPEIISLLDQATLLAEKKIEQAGTIIVTLNDVVVKKIVVEEKKTTLNATKKPKNETKKPPNAPQKPAKISTASKPKNKISVTLEEEDLSFMQSISAVITSMIVSIFGSTEPGDPASPAPQKKPVSAKSG